MLCGCVPAADSPPAAPVAPQQLDLARTGAVTWPQPQWWRAYGDPQLDRLIAAAEAGNPSLQIAAARVQLAQQAAVQLGAVNDPNLAFNAEVNRQRYSENYIYQPPLAGGTFTDARAALDFSYEFDFWGGQRAALRAARTRVEAERAERTSAQLIIAVAVARSYFALQGAQTEAALARSAVQQHATLVKLYALRAERGLASRDAAEPQRAALAAAQQDQEAQEHAVAVYRHQLAALTGRGPQALDGLIAAPAKAAPLRAPAQVPADLLARRPDIVALRLRVEAARGDIAAAEAEFYPNVDLAAFFGFQSLGAGDLLRGSSRTYGAGPALHLPLFNRAALRADLGASRADYDAAVAQYNQGVLDAAREVADQGSALRTLARQRAAAQRGLAALQRAYDGARLRRSRGLGTELEVLEAHTALLDRQRALAQLRDDELQTQVALIKALGGGYGAETAPPQHAEGE